MRYENRTFTDEPVLLDDHIFVNCTFVRCKLVFCAVVPVSMDSPTFTDCKWALSGPAELTLRYMTTLYAGGLSQLVEATFNSIRGKPDSGGVALN